MAAQFTLILADTKNQQELLSMMHIIQEWNKKFEIPLLVSVNETVALFQENSYSKKLESETALLIWKKAFEIKGIFTGLRSSGVANPYDLLQHLLSTYNISESETQMNSRLTFCGCLG